MPREHLIVFTRYPIAGKAKTRLIPALGAQGAADMQRALTELTLCRAMALAVSRGVTLEVRYEGGDERTLREWLGDKPRHTPQGDGDLGQRLARAARSAFANNAESVVIIGADCPRLDEAILAQAFDALRQQSVVLGPAQDGGYYLVGLRKPLLALFEGITWSTDHTLDDTLAKARGLGEEPMLLTILPDVDEPPDLGDWQCQQPLLSSVSVIIPTLNEAAHLEETLRLVVDARPHEIIISDSGSTDGTLEIAAKLGTQIVLSERGRGAQMNAGASHATGEHLFFLHADTLPPVNFIDAIATTLVSPRHIVGAFSFALREPRPRGARIIQELTALRCRWRSLPYGDQGLFMRRRMFEALQGFREWLILEDLDLVTRARAHGTLIIHPLAAQTSARRWQKNGVFPTFLRHQMILLGYYAGLSPDRLAAWR